MNKCYRTLVYDGKLYENFKINSSGDVLNCKTGNVLKKTIFKDGYWHVTLPLGKRGVVKSIRVHKAIAETFIPNPKNLPFVDHKDENKLNCCVDNLQWISSKDNTNKHWEMLSKTDPYCNNRKLTDENVKYIREHMDVSGTILAKMFNVSRTTINNVKHRYLYK